jgi:FixJ family two-component response regulator
LVADDDMDTRKIWSDSLTYWGANVLNASDGDQALCLAAKYPIDLALLDVRMPGPSGMELAARLQQLDPGVAVIIVTAHASIERAVDAMRRGAFTYLSKPCRPARVCEIVARAWDEQQFTAHEKIGGWDVDWRRGEVMVDGVAARFCDLSQRGRDVLDQLVIGKTDEEIAETLDIGACTVRTHLRKITARFGLRNRGQAILLWDRYKRQRRRARWN